MPFFSFVFLVSIFCSYFMFHYFLPSLLLSGVWCSGSKESNSAGGTLHHVTKDMSSCYQQRDVPNQVPNKEMINYSNQALFHYIGE
jgi:hypothetical protein